jgi:hypothetical protein
VCGTRSCPWWLDGETVGETRVVEKLLEIDRSDFEKIKSKNFVKVTDLGPKSDVWRLKPENVLIQDIRQR